MIVFENFFRELFKSELLIFIIRGIFLMFMLKIMVMFLIDVLICYFLIFRLSRIGVVVFRFFMLICFWNWKRIGIEDIGVIRMLNKIESRNNFFNFFMEFYFFFSYNNCFVGEFDEGFLYVGDYNYWDIFGGKMF